MNDLQVHVSIGEVKTGEGSQILKASLGSCVGIALLWKKRKLYGLAHCLLAEAPQESSIITARYVSQALPSLMSLMKILPADHREIEAVLVGGGNMTAETHAPPEKLVGYLNGLAAEKYLKKFGFPIIHKDLGGEAGRKILVFCETGEFTVNLIPRISKRAAS